ncbi:rRNA 2'-O-methyltransferase fibrillarin-like [Fagus crenata]
MTRNLGALVDARIDDAGILLETPSGLLLLGMIIMSLSIISMVIFACGDDKSRKRRPGIGGVAGGGCGGGGGGGGGGCGGGGGGGC